MEVAPGLAGLPPDVALWLLELRGGLGLPIAWTKDRDLAADRLLDDQLDLDSGSFGPLLRSTTLEDLSEDLPPAMEVLSPTASTQDSDTAGQMSDLDQDQDSDRDSDHSVDSLEDEAARAVPVAVPVAVPPPCLRALPPLPPLREEDMLARLSGGECRALPAVPEEDEEDLTLEEDDDDDGEESVTVLQALGWSTSLDGPSLDGPSLDEPSLDEPSLDEPSFDGPSYRCPSPPPPLCVRRSHSASSLKSPVVTAPSLRRASSAPQLLPVSPLPSPTPTPSPTLTASTPSPTLSTLTACAEALESAEALCRELDDDRTLSQSVSVDEDMVFDDEFLALCSEATRLVETCLMQDTGPSRPIIGPHPAPDPAPSLASAYQLSKLDINTIFDDGLGGPEPPRPPARKRRKARFDLVNEHQQHHQEREHVHVLQDQVVERRRCRDRSGSASESSVAAELEVEVRCHTSELLLMTRASKRTLLKRSRSVSAADRDPSCEVKPTLCASSPELRSPQSPACNTATLDELFLTLDTAVPDTLSDKGADSDLSSQPRRKGSVSSDVIAWQYDLIWAGLSDDEDADDALGCLETKQWFSSSDNKGRVYFFEENSTESSWNLPDVNSSIPQDSTFEDESHHPAQTLSFTPAEGGGERTVKIERSEKQEKLSLRTTKSRSMVIVDSGAKDPKNVFTPRNWPQLFDGDMCVLKEGSMYRTKITENGKKLRKNWASSHVVLTELFLLLFRDAKSFAAMKSATQGAPRPELCVDLNGALIDHVDRGDKASVTSRKNVFLVSTVLGLQVLFQCDSSQQAEEWYSAVHTAIHNLPSGFDSCPRIKVTKEMDRLFGESNSPEQAKKFPRIGRSKSVKIKNKEGSIEDLTVSVAERQTKIKARLKKFFNRRPTMESLVKKGIWKDEPAFGCYLEQVCSNESPRVPLFVQRCIAVIESSEDNMKTDGLYRASGNLSQVQKIRLQVDQNNLSALDQEEDVHVLTGALKLFFRELKEPLIPYAAFSKAIKASTLQNKKEKLAHFREIVKSLPTANHDTLKVLLKHLLKVTAYQEFNRMHIPNLAIVFGPTLMWPEQESLNMALDLMQQNLVIEAFLLDFENIFR